MIRLACTSTIPANQRALTALMMPDEVAVPDPCPLASLPRTACTASTEAALDIPIADWDDLFHAIQARLRALVSLPPATFYGSPSPAVSDDVRTVVLECVTALDQLHRALSQERGLHQPLDPVTADADLVATRSLAELVGSPASSLAVVRDPTRSPRTAVSNPGRAAEVR